MLQKHQFQTLVVGLTCFEVIRRIEIEQRQRLRWTAHVHGIRRQSVDAQPGCLLSSIGINFNPEIDANRAEQATRLGIDTLDRKSTRLNSSHVKISYAV